MRYFLTQKCKIKATFVHICKNYQISFFYDKSFVCWESIILSVAHANKIVKARQSVLHSS